MMSDYWVDRKVFITGAGGFIGSHLVEALVDHGSRVRAFVRYNSRNDPGLLRWLPPETYEKVKIIPGDLCDQAAVEEAMEGVSHVFHLGALISIPYSYLHPGEVVETNIIGTLNVLQAARKAKIERLVHTSSSEVYGTALHVPIDENHPLQCQSPYSASKIGADKLVESFFRSFDVPAVTMRPFNTYGPRQSTRAVIPTIITQVLTQDVVRLGNLEARRDLTYISDTVEGFLRVGETPGIEGKTINLGSGVEVSINELAEYIIQLIGKDVKIEVDGSRLRPEKSEVERLLADNSQAHELLGWQPNIDLKTGLNLTIDWFKEHINLYQTDQYQV